MPEDRDRMAALSWDTHWRGRRAVRRGFLSGRLLAFLVARGDFSRLIFEQLRAGGLVRPGSLVLEAGCGSGDMLLRLTGESVTCVGADTSGTAARSASKHAMGGVRASVTALPFKQGSFEGVYSVGLLDQLSEGALREAAVELARVAAPGGAMVLVNSSARSRVHGSVMRLLAARGRWPWGEKSQFESLESLMRPALPGCSVTERELGWLLQWRFLGYLLPAAGFARMLCNGMSLVLNAVFWPLNRIPGMVLVTEVRKPSDPASRSGGREGASG